MALLNAVRRQSELYSVAVARSGGPDLLLIDSS